MFSFRQSCFIPMQIALVSNGVFAADYSTLGVADGWMNNMGLAEIPTNIPCMLVGNLDFRNNLITRIETNSFFCLHEITTLDISYNKIIYIAPGAFDQLRSLEVVRLKGNRDLPELPPHYGPNTANMKTLFIQHINPQIIPTDSYFDQMPTLQTLALGTDLSNDFFDGWTSLRNLYFYGNIAPYFTGRTPNVERIEMKNKAMSTKNMPSENVVGLTKLKRFEIRSCDMLPLFEGAVTLEILDVASCEITSLPDYRHLISLQTFNPDSSHFQCDTKSCWMLFETISNPVLASAVQTIACQRPEKFKGLSVLGLSPVQLHCFKGR